MNLQKYLSNIIKPFRDRIVWIKKIDSPIQNYEYIKICYHDHNYTIVLNFPDFKVGTMYKGMELCKDYTLEELAILYSFNKEDGKIIANTIKNIINSQIESIVDFGSTPNLY